MTTEHLYQLLESIVGQHNSTVYPDEARALLLRLRAAEELLKVLNEDPQRLKVHSAMANYRKAGDSK